MKEMHNPKEEVKTSNGNTKEQAIELMAKLGIECIYYTTDGYWFSKKSLADEHAKRAKTDVKEYKK